MTVKEILEEKINGIGAGWQTYLSPSIPEKKLKNAAKFIAGGINESDILGICDVTIFGSAKEGLVFTETSFYAHNTETAAIEYTKITKVEVDGEYIYLFSNDNLVWQDHIFYNAKRLQILLCALCNLDYNEESKPKFTIDFTMNQHQLPWQSKEGEFDNFLGLKFGATFLESVFLLRCLGWKPVESFRAKTMRGTEVITLCFANDNSTLCEYKINGLMLSYNNFCLKRITALFSFNKNLKNTALNFFERLHNKYGFSFDKKDYKLFDSKIKRTAEALCGNNDNFVLRFSEPNCEDRTKQDEAFDLEYDFYLKAVIENEKFMQIFGKNGFAVSSNFAKLSDLEGSAKDIRFVIFLVFLMIFNTEEKNNFVSLNENGFEILGKKILSIVDATREEFNIEDIKNEVRMALATVQNEMNSIKPIQQNETNFGTSQPVVQNMSIENTKEKTFMGKELMVEDDGELLFSEILKKIVGMKGSIEYVIDDSQTIAKMTASGTTILFFPEHIAIQLKNTTQSCAFAYGEWNRWSFGVSQQKNDDGSQKYDWLFDHKILTSYNEDYSTKLKETFTLLSQLFTDKITCTPKYELTQKVREFLIVADDSYNKALYELLIKHSERFDEITDEDLLEENSKILQVLAEHSGKIFDNLGDTLKKNFSIKGFLNNGGISGIVSTAISLGGAAGDRIAGDITASGCNLIILTDKKVILSLKNEPLEYSFEDILMGSISAKDDEVLANVVDIYNDSDEKILEDVSKTDWLTFRKKLRKLKKEAESISDFEETLPQQELPAFTETPQNLYNFSNPVSPSAPVNPQPINPMRNLVTGQTSPVTSLTCDKCGTQSPVGTKFCLNCGDPFILCPVCKQDNPNEAKFCIFCGAPMKRICGNCGAEYVAGAKFCGGCGQKL